ncbi:IS3 family transposase [Gilliamella sp. Pas-s95]|uniref:IS3 family transposase n=1 Tax=Gilliamella sp. Pas-s95 TaxID=2687317 RepID=UPI00351B1B80
MCKKSQRFNSMAELKLAFSAYSYWYNHKRLHSSLGYLPPVKFKKHLSLNFLFENVLPF